MIRFMPLFSDGEYSIKIGPKRIFARRDGLFIPHDMQHRSLLIEYDNSIFDETTVIRHPLFGDDRPLLTELRILMLGGNHVDRSLDDGLRGSDPHYTRWLTSLTAFLDDFDFALPVRTHEEYMSSDPPPLRVEFVQNVNARPVAPTIRFELPPEGILITSPAPQYNFVKHAEQEATEASNAKKKKLFTCPVCRHETQDSPPLICPNCYTGIPADVKDTSLHWPALRNLSPDSSEGNDGRHIADY